MSYGVGKPEVEAFMGLSLKVGKQQCKAPNKFIGSCLQSFAFMWFRSGDSDNPGWFFNLFFFFFDTIFYRNMS